MVPAIDGPQHAQEQEARAFWWEQISPPLLSLLQSTGYSTADQKLYAEFVNQFVIPSLGPRPITTKSGVPQPYFDSFCSDDFSPAELSWNVGPGGNKIRIGSEPIGPHAGSLKDPFNQNEPEVVMARLLRHHHGQGAIDVELWELFKKHLHVGAEYATEIVAKMAANEHMTTNTISFDLDGEFPAPKIYFYPIPVSLLRDMPEGDVISDMIPHIPLNLAPSFRYVRDFMCRYNDTHSQGGRLRVELIAFDAVRPTDSRFKLYLRTKETCLARVEEVYTLGGTLQGTQVEEGLNLIRLFYMHVLGVTDHEEELPLSTHRTAGIIFNMEIKHNQAQPVPKVYIPIRHYGGTDLRIAQNMANLFRACGLIQMADTYVEAVQRAFPAQDFSKTIGRQSYVGLSINKNRPYITVYYNTMTFSKGHERNESGKLIGPAAWTQRHLLDC